MSIVSPCISICTLDPRTGYCLGCGRTGAEIASWVAYGKNERAAIMLALPARMAQIAPPPPPIQEAKR